MVSIVHFGKYYFPDTGGIESVTQSLSAGAAIEGHKVSVICFDKSNSSKLELINGVLVHRLPILLTLFSQPIGFRYFLRCITVARNANIIHVHTPNMLAAICALFIPANTKLLVHWHSDVINKGILGNLFHPLVYLLLKKSDCIIATSKIYATASYELLPFINKIKVIPLGVPNQINSYDGVSLPVSILNHIRGRNIVLAVGRLVPYKGFDLLIEAAKFINTDSTIVIVGTGPLERKLLQLMEDFEVCDRVILTGKLSSELLHLLFERASLFCLPSIDRAEAFGVVLLEAMAYGVPIVSSDIPGSGVPWVNLHGVSGFNVPVGNPIALADACNQILASSDLRNKLSLGARERFLTNFTEVLSVNQMMSVYKSLLSSN